MGDLYELGMPMNAEQSPVTVAARPWLTGFRISLIILAFHLAMIPFGHGTRGGGPENLYASDFDKRGFNAGPYAWVAWKTHDHHAGNSPDPMRRYGIPGLSYTVAGGMGSFVIISFVWTLGLNLAAVLWFGRRDIARAWRTRPRLPRVRLVIERRHRLTA